MTNTKNEKYQSFQTLLAKANQEHRTIIMGILNVTPDSFSDGGKYLNPNQAIAHAKQMLQDGADIIDIGGESTKPGSTPVTAKEELNRVIPIIQALTKKFNLKENPNPPFLISIDSMKPEIANEALKTGAHIINDVTGLRNKEMINIAVKHQCPVIIMHMRDQPKTMQQDITNATYNGNCTNYIKNYLQEQANAAITAGIKPHNIVLDPGIGFGKTVKHNLELINNIEQFKKLNIQTNNQSYIRQFSILMGPSRKSFIGKLTQKAMNLKEPTSATNRLEGTLAAVTACALNGANIVRVHDVKETKRALVIADVLRKLNKG